MAQQNYQIPPPPGRPYSPPQQSASPGATPGFSLPPNKRQRLSPDPRLQPQSPYVQSPYPMTSGTVGPTPRDSTHFSHISLPPNIYNTPYANGHSTSSANASSSTPTYSPSQNPYQQSNSSQTQQSPVPNGTNLANTLHPNNQFYNQNNYSMGPQGVGMMGPPLKTVEREVVNDDQMDVLANAGVDLRAEENYAMSFHTGSFNSQPIFSQSERVHAGHAYTQFSPGDSKSFYGAGPANQVGHPTDKNSQDEEHQKAADRAWAEAAHNLARSRQHELNNPHVDLSTVWGRVDRIVRDNGLNLHTVNGRMGDFKLPSDFQAEVRVRTAVGPQSGMTVTGGRFLPADSAFVDQMALVSLATNLRIRMLLEDAVAISRGRRTGSYGVVPSEWADVSAPGKVASGTTVVDGSKRKGCESAVSPRTKPLNDSLLSANRLPTPVSDGANTPNGAVTYTNELTHALRKFAEVDRSFEEGRLVKRQSRSTGDGTPRASSVAPGTPGSVAPEPTNKPLTKKEREKQEKGKQSVADTHAQANATTAKFLLGGKRKTYSWMNDARSGSGTATPSRITTQGLQGMPGIPSSGASEKPMLTSEGIKKWGLHREDRKDQPMQVELRDLLAVLEDDGKEKKTLQQIYAWLDNPKSRKA